MKLLSILIPTYNRGDYLTTTLKVLSSQILQYKDLVEILISNNASTDNTDIVVKNYAKTIPIKYNLNDYNIGFAKNFEKLIKDSDGEYLYLMGDDDIVSPNFIKTIIELLINNKDCSIVHWNRLSGDQMCKHGALVDDNYIESVWVTDAKNFILTIREKANFISSLIFHRDCWQLGMAYIKEEYVGYEWFAQLYWGALVRDKKCIYYYFPLVIQRNPSKSWIKFWPQYYISSMSNIFYDLDTLVPGVYNSWIKKMRITTSNILPEIANYRSFYCQPSIRKLMIRHLSRQDKWKYYYYLYIPGSLFFHRLKYRLLRIIEMLLG